MKLAKCNIIEGNLDINIQIGGQTTNAEKFTEAFGNIREIIGFGYTVAFSMPSKSVSAICPYDFVQLLPHCTCLKVFKLFMERNLPAIAML